MSNFYMGDMFDRGHTHDDGTMFFANSAIASCDYNDCYERGIERGISTTVSASIDDSWCDGKVSTLACNLNNVATSAIDVGDSFDSLAERIKSLESMVKGVKPSHNHVFKCAANEWNKCKKMQPLGGIKKLSRDGLKTLREG